MAITNGASIPNKMKNDCYLQTPSFIINADVVGEAFLFKHIFDAYSEMVIKDNHTDQMIDMMIPYIMCSEITISE